MVLRSNVAFQSQIFNRAVLDPVKQRGVIIFADVNGDFMSVAVENSFERITGFVPDLEVNVVNIRHELKSKSGSVAAFFHVVGQSFEVIFA